MTRKNAKMKNTRTENITKMLLREKINMRYHKSKYTHAQKDIRFPKTTKNSQGSIILPGRPEEGSKNGRQKIQQEQGPNPPSASQLLIYLVQNPDIKNRKHSENPVNIAGLKQISPESTMP